MLQGIIIPPGIGVATQGNRPPNDIALTPYTSDSKPKVSLLAGSSSVLGGNYRIRGDSTQITNTGSLSTKARNLRGVTSGLYYAEVSTTDPGGATPAIGVCDSTFNADISTSALGSNTNSSALLGGNGTVRHQNVTVQTLTAWAVLGQRACMEVDATNRTARFRVGAGAWSNPVSLAAFNLELFLVVQQNNEGILTLHADAASWIHTPPVGAQPWPNGSPGVKGGHDAPTAVDAVASIDVPFPTDKCDISANDLLLLPIYSNGNIALNTPAGWNELGPAGGWASGTTSKFQIYWKRAVGGESGNQTVTRASAGVAGNVFAGVMDVFNNVITDGNPFSGLTSVVRASASTLQGEPITPTNRDQLAIQYFITGAQTIWNDNDGWDLKYVSINRSTSVGNDAGFNMAARQGESGVTLGAASETGTGSAGEYVSVTFLLNPRAESNLYVHGMEVELYTPIGWPLFTISGTDPDLLDTLTFAEAPGGDPDNKFTISGNIVYLANTMGSSYFYQTLDPANKSSDITLSNGNRTATRNVGSSGFWANAATYKPRTNKQWYFEAQFNARTTQIEAGVLYGDPVPLSFHFPGQQFNGAGLRSNGNVYHSDSVVVTGALAPVDVGDWIGIHVDLDNDRIRFANVTDNPGSPTWTAWYNFGSGLYGIKQYPVVSTFDAGDSLTINLGSVPFVIGALPSDTLAWGTQETYSYDNPLGSGPRQVAQIGAGNGIICSDSGSWLVSTAETLIESNYNTTNYFGGVAVAGRWIKFEFPTPRVMAGFRFIQQPTYSQGEYEWQGSNDNVNWTTLTSIASLGASPVIPTRYSHVGINEYLFSNTTAYKYYRLLGISGSSTSTPWVYEFEFLIDNAGIVLGNGHSLTIRATDQGGLTYDETFGINFPPAGLRVSQEHVEVLANFAAQTRVSQEYVEALTKITQPVVISQEFVEALVKMDRAIEVSQEFMEILAATTPASGTWTYLGNTNGASIAAAGTITDPGTIVGGNTFQNGDLALITIAWRGGETVTAPANWNLVGEDHTGTAVGSNGPVSIGSWWAPWSAGLSFAFNFSANTNNAICRVRGYRPSLPTITLVDAKVVPTANADPISTATGLAGAINDLIHAGMGASYSASSHLVGVSGTGSTFGHAATEAGTPSGADVWVGADSGVLTTVGTGVITADFNDTRGHAMVVGTFRCSA